MFKGGRLVRPFFCPYSRYNLSLKVSVYLNLSSPIILKKRILEKSFKSNNAWHLSDNEIFFEKKQFTKIYLTIFAFRLKKR